MTLETEAKIKEFQAETKQVLRLVIHSLYSHKEIFLRELISNASDACEKLRFEALAKPELMGTDSLSIALTPDSAARTLSIKDNGIGMSEEEVIDNLGTIARSGTKKFLETLSGDAAKDAQLIGQFGVGFYSAFIVADKVTVLSKRCDAPAVRWESDGEGQYQIQASDKADRGTEVILHLREEDKEFLEAGRLRQLVRKYSDHLSIPIVLQGGEKDETLNQAKAFWTRPKADLKDEDYQAFYQHITHDSEGARVWAHNKVEGNIEYTSLLYLPKRAPFDLFEREQKGGVQLYVKRVFIMDKAAELLPPYLRFMRGLVDSADLPLNVSRELLQNNRTVEKIKAALVKRSLDLLEELAANKPQEYAEFWQTFGAVLKEGIIEDPGQKTRIAKLLRFHSTAAAGNAPEGDSGGIHIADEAGSKGHLLPDCRYPGRCAQQSASRGLSRQGLGSSTAHRSHRRMGGRPFARVRGQDARQCRERGRRCGVRHRNSGEGGGRIRLQEYSRAARQELERQDRQCAALRTSHRFARRSGRGRIRREPANGAHPQAGRPQQSIRNAADSRVESQASARAASQ